MLIHTNWTHMSINGLASCLLMNHVSAWATSMVDYIPPWPAFPPDLSPIEHLWDILDRAVRRRCPCPATVLQLRLALTEEWNNIPQHTIQRLVASMRRRCRAVLDAAGGHTRYWHCHVDIPTLLCLKASDERVEDFHGISCYALFSQIVGLSCDAKFTHVNDIKVYNITA